MKRLFIFLVFAAVSAMAAFAQKGLAVDELFEGSYKKQKNVTEVIVEGAQVKPFGLSLFRSFTVVSDAALAGRMEQFAKADGKKATDKEEGLKGGRLYYAFYSFANGDGTYRYLFFRNNLLVKGAKPETTIVYMEGKATLSELKKMFGKK